MTGPTLGDVEPEPSAEAGVPEPADDLAALEELEAELEALQRALDEIDRGGTGGPG